MAIKASPRLAALSTTALAGLLAIGTAVAGDNGEAREAGAETNVSANMNTSGAAPAVTNTAAAATGALGNVAATAQGAAASPSSSQVDANRTAVDSTDTMSMKERMQAAVAKQQYVLTPSNSRLGFASSARLIGTVSGDFQDYLIVVSENDNGNIELRSNIKSADIEMTQNKGRKGMLMEDGWFAPNTYPTISYIGDVNLSDSMTAAGGEGQVDGTLIFRGVSNPEDMNLTFSCAGIQNCPEAGIKVSGNMKIDRNTYGMTEMGAVVRDEVVIDVDGTLMPR